MIVRVAQRRHVAELAALGDVAQQPAHDLARARLGQVVGPDDAPRARELADALGDVLAQLGDQLVGALEVALERHVGDDRLPGVLVGLADDGRLGHLAGATTIADSTSAVDRRWPETLMTSSTRPTIQK